ncbi:glyoxylase-like metal-dependent hydrolase (beta-lactamase superfamily II) [Methanobacterium petrolearium]|nr:glyoxylase-like metal-dependent hydrolase (beta-lactamase superfamily II) [Methanobacterium petrolearium]BDZ69851.1 MBL fold metallo-hydrolase [Methanobacterium petrolearium]
MVSNIRKINDIIIIDGMGYDSNVYVFNDIIVDTGTGQNMDYILKSIKDAGGSVDDLSLIVNTHHHYDHIGGNQYLDLEVAMHSRDARALEEGDQEALLATMFGKSMEKMKIHHKLEEGDKIHDFEVLLTPGHTSGSICLYDGETLISGDTVFADGGFGRVDLGGDMGDMRRSLERLSKLDIKYLLPGHGPAVEDGSKHVKMAHEIATGYY